MRSIPKSFSWSIAKGLTLFLACLSLAQAQTPAHEEPVSLQTSSGTLYGSLFLPASQAPIATPVPIILLHAGSGPTDRDGNSSLIAAHNDGLKQLAQALAARGIASLRYDKRGIGESRSAMSREQDLRFDVYAQDLADWVSQMRKDRRFDRIVLGGHSEGSLIAMLAAQLVPVDGFISLAGASRRAADLLREQTRPQVTDGQFAQFDEALREIEAGQSPHSAPTAPPFLARLFRTSLLPYLGSWIRRNPSEEIAKLTAPTLIVQGTLDERIPPAAGEELKQARPDATLAIIENMHHTLKETPATIEGQRRAWSDPTTPLSSHLVDVMVEFVNRITTPDKARQ